jgi:hypothetical protein
MGKQLLSLCSVGRIANRDGGVGPLARIFLPFYGYVFANGQQLTDTNTAGEVAQDQSIRMVGQVKPDVFSKNCCGTCTGQ